MKKTGCNSVPENTKAIKDMATKRSQGYDNIAKAADVVLAFIKHKKRILYGGMSIDYALKLAGQKGIYDEDAVPDYDFMSPDFYNDSNELGEILLAKGFTGISCINASHISTRRVRIDFVPVADITYMPPNIYEQVPTLTYKGIRIVAPTWQRLDIHRALSHPLEGPPLEVFAFRASKDIKRFKLLAAAYPINGIKGGKREKQSKPPKQEKQLKQERGTAFSEQWSLWKDAVVGGTQAYCLMRWIMEKLLDSKIAPKDKKLIGELKADLAKTVGATVDATDGDVKIVMDAGADIKRVNIITDTFASVVAAFKNYPTEYYNKYVDDLRPRTVIITTKTSTYEVFDNKGRIIAYTDLATALQIVGMKTAISAKICSPQYVMLYFLQKHFEFGDDGDCIYLRLYDSMAKLVEMAEKIYMHFNVVDSSPAATEKLNELFNALPFFLPTQFYGSANWTPDYISFIKEKTYMINDTPEAERETMRPPFGYYPERAHEKMSEAKTKAMLWQPFDPNTSPFFRFDGAKRDEPFKEITL